ncbi:ABC transporter permease [Rubinisphaera italica]|uniref:Putative ABC transporter permease YknZ n=1 Tax=Rubinisphaera italica TaxID=2527969 RepID=A0A5C5X9T6_9PLAN|nr:ABC transporter permease [Rubinisphaera italica]TWT59917.1 putative ABC transporter permease YknZ [Rubinisphaera italica]
MNVTRNLRAIDLALKSLLLQRLRSGLTMLGIVFGVFSVIAMLAIGEGASQQAQEQVLKLGANNIIVRSKKPPEGSTSNSGSSGARVLRYGLLRADYKLLHDSIPTVSDAIPIRETSHEARYRDRKLAVRVVGCNPKYLDVNHLEVSRGRFVTDQDEFLAENVAILGSATADTLFPYENPIGKTVMISNQPYQVVGYMKQRQESGGIGGSLTAQDFNSDIYIPLKTFSSRFGDLIIRFTSGSFTAEQVELNQITLQVKDRNDVMPTAEVVKESLKRNHATDNDYAIVVPLELLKQADQIRAIFNMVLGSIAAISLVVGGIGIMNIMLATVTERTREIGIRRALGATRKDIVQQFLTETIVLAGTGGVIGIIMGLLTPWAFNAIKFVAIRILNLDASGGDSEFSKIFLEMQPQIAIWSLPMAFGISVAIGIIFGVYPARSAARLDPIEALRHE